jgi:hypothetical protein
LPTAGRSAFLYKSYCQIKRKDEKFSLRNLFSPSMLFHISLHRRTRTREITVHTCNTDCIRVKWSRLQMFQIFSINPDKKWKGKYTILWGTGGTNLRILNLGPKCKWVSSFMIKWFYSVTHNTHILWHVSVLANHLQANT